MPVTPRPFPWKRALLGAYLALLAASHVVRRVRPDEGDPPEPLRWLTVRGVDGEREEESPVRIAYRDLDAAAGGDAATVVLLHGSPGDGGAFRGMAPLLADRFRVVVPDLPGFGWSTHRVPDYSIRAHARYVVQLLDSLGVEEAHLVGFSMGGGVALNVYDLAPRRVASLVLVSSIGVQEMELLGDYHLNHAVHGLQLAGLWLIREAVPHMGAMDRAFLGVEYARNFYDTDQRPLRGILRRYDGPMQILHGDGDFLVPPHAAREHHRIVPQSELTMFAGDHFMVFMRPAVIAAPVADFVSRVEAGEALTRAEAAPARVAAALEPFDATSVPRAAGFSLLVVMLLIAAATLVSEDLTCIGAGLMVARGTIGFGAAATACFVGITVGDVLLYLAGRYLGRPALARAPLNWFVTDADVARSSAWFRRRGAAVVLLSRFTPGTRLATYFASGTLRTSFWWFAGYFALAAALWTPMLVGLSAVFGGQVRDRFAVFQGSAVWFLAVMAATLFIAVKLVVPAFTRRGRRLLLSRWRRLTRWEFWPPVVFYPPVVAWVGWLALRYRSLTLFTAANPGIEGGGFVGESKHRILAPIAAAHPGAVARTALVPADLPPDERVARVEAFMAEHGLACPIVLKPDVGERGRGVRVIRSMEAARRYLEDARADVLAQEYVPGEEFGVFYHRHPDEPRGAIFSITAKRFPTVTGDGVSTLEDLILAHDRAVSSARLFLRAHAARAAWVPARGEAVPLVEVGTHCRGAEFLDGSRLVTEALVDAVDRLSRALPGFHFGRYDIRVPSAEDLQAGRHLRIVELNGVTSEATNIYDPSTGLGAAYRTLFRQWALLFRIAAANRDRGARPASLWFLVRVTARHFARSRRS